MAIASLTLPVAGLDDLSNESRMIATPWSRMVRGIGLGQYPVDYDPAVAGRIREALDLLAAKMPFHSYTVFSRLLADLVLTVADPATPTSEAEIRRALGPVVAAVRGERNAYYRVTAGSILLDAFAKLGLDLKLLVNDSVDFPAEVLASVDDIQPEGIKDYNSGQHGAYEQLSAYSAVFLALGQLGLKDRLVTGERDHVTAALDLLQDVPSPFFRVRGGSMLLSVVSVLGYDALIFDGERDYMKEVLDHLDRTFEPGNEVSFPQPATSRFAKTYPLLTLLNAIAVCGREAYLSYGRDRLAEIKELMGTISGPERSHMTLYYVMALHNLGRLTEQIPDLDAYLEDSVGLWRDIDPGEDFFIHGVSYPYLIETAMLTGRMDLITDEALERQADAFPDHDRTEQDRVNRPFPLSYALNAFGEIGVVDRLFAPRARYGGSSAVAWVIDHFSENGREEGIRLTMVDHALVSYALRLRGPHRRDTDLFKNFRFRLTDTPGGSPAGAAS
jgi:hypothetical protein